MSETPKSVVFDPTETRALLESGKGAMLDARTIVVDSHAMYEEAGAVCATVKGSIKLLEDEKEKLLIPVRAIDRAIRSLFDPAINARKAVETDIKNKQTAYLRVCEEQRAAAQRAADEATRKERERLERDAAAAKAKGDQEAEAARKRAEEAELARKKAEADGNGRAAAAAAAAVAKANEEARQKEEAGARQAAELHERAAMTSSQSVAEALPTAKGGSQRRPWKAKVVDKAALIRSIAANPEAYMHLLDIDEGKLNKMAGAQQKGLEKVLNGIEVFQDITLAQKAA